MDLIEIKKLIEEGKTEEGILEIRRSIETADCDDVKSDLLYFLGNVYRKQADWKNALDNYQRAIDLNSDSPAVEAKKMTMDILEFFHKDMYNQ